MPVRNSRAILLIMGVVTLMVLTPLVAPALAGETRFGDRVIVPADEVLTDDLYATGDTIIIDGTVEGDVIAAGKEIRINGKVTGDLIATGWTIVINGTIEDDVRIAGFDLQVTETALIGDDVTAAGFNLNARSGSQIGGDLYAVGFQAEFNGELEGSFKGVMNSLVIGGGISGDVSVEVGEPGQGISEWGPLANLIPFPLLPSGLHVQDTARIKGTLNYTSPSEGVISQKADIDGVVYATPPIVTRPEREEIERPEIEVKVGWGWLVVKWIVDQLRRLISLLVVGLLLAWLVPILVPQAAAKLREKPWPSLGWGCAAEIAFFIAVPVIFAVIIGAGVILALLTLGGLQGALISTGLLLEGLAIVAFTVVTSWVTKVVVGYFIGWWLLTQARSNQATGPVWPAIIGIVLFVIVRSIPILGWFAGLAATLFGLGALLLWARDRWWPSGPAPMTGPLPNGTQHEKGAPTAVESAAGTQGEEMLASTAPPPPPAGGVSTAGREPPPEDRPVWSEEEVKKALEENRPPGEADTATNEHLALENLEELVRRQGESEQTADRQENGDAP